MNFEMGSVPFAGEYESLHSTSNRKSGKLWTTLLDGCDAITHVSIPRKLRSAMKKRGRESIISPLLISRKQRQKLKRDGAKKSKLNMKLGQHITKDEEEVAETLYALAGFFSDPNKAKQPELDGKKSEIESSAAIEEGSSMNATRVEEIKSHTIEAPQPEFFSSMRAVAPNAYGDQSELSPCSSSRPASILGMNQTEQEIHLDEVTASRSQYGNNCSSTGNKYTDFFLAPDASGATISEMHQSCSRVNSLFESTNFSFQPCAIDNKITTEKHTRVARETNTPRKRCSSHVYISWLIKVLQTSDKKEKLSLQPTQSTTCGGAERESNVSIHNQTPSINDGNGSAHFSTMNIFSAKTNSSNILLDKRPIQDQQMISETTSAKQEYDFLSLGTGLCGSDSGNGAKPPQQFHMPYMQQSKNHSSMSKDGYSSSFHGHNSTLAAQQVQIPQYHSSAVNFMGQQMESKWADWRNGIDSASIPNHYAPSLFPHLHAALGSKYQQLSPSQHQFMPINSNISKLHHKLPLGFETNRTMFCPENMVQLQLPCNHHL